MAAQHKLSLLMELHNKLFNTKLQESQDKLSKVTGKMTSSLNKLKMNHANAFNAMSDKVPQLGDALSLLGNPYALAAAGVVALGALAAKGFNEAKKFNHEFLAIKNLNLDKSTESLNAYKEQIRDAAFATGKDLSESTVAFYDLQSATGLYGKEAVSVFTKVANYSTATGANLQDSMKSTVKAMAAFKMGVNDIDKYLISNAKTVQTGIVNFDQLAQVQTEFAGAAAGAGQGIDTANKLFAVFSKVSKDANTGATMVKGAFEGLSQKSTIEGLQGIGISLYDAKGNMRQLDGVIGDVAAKFKTMTPKQIDEFINKVGGPEGLRNMFVMLKNNAQDFQNTINAFDSSKFDLDAALKNAQGDYTKLSEIVGNQFNTLMSKLGEKILPMVITGMDWLSKALKWTYKNGNDIVGVLQFMIGGMLGLVGWVGVAIYKFESFGAAMLFIMGPIGRVIAAFILLYKHWDSIVSAFKTDGIIGGLKRIGQVLLDTLLLPLQQVLEIASKIPGIGNIAGNGASAIRELRKSMNLIPEKKKEDKTNEVAPYQTKVNPLGGMPTSPTNSPSGSLGKVAGSQLSKTVGDGGGGGAKSIVINIDSFVKGGINTSQTTLAKMNKEELETWLRETFMRMVRNAEMSYA